MKGSIVAEEEECEDKETNQDKCKIIVKNLKKHVKDINMNGEGETDRAEDYFEIGMSVIDVDEENKIVRIDDEDGKEEKNKL